MFKSLSRVRVSLLTGLICLTSLFLCPQSLKAKINDNNANGKRPLIIDIGAARAPFTLVLPSGQPTGLYVEFWQLWSKHNKIPVAFKVSGFENIQAALDAGSIDFQSGLFKNTQREKWADFSIPFHRVRSGLYYLYSDKNPPNLDELNRQGDQKVAVHRKSFQSAYLEENYPDIPLVYYQEASDIFDRFISGDIRAIIAEQPYMDSQMAGKGLRGLFKLGYPSVLSNDVSAVVKKGNLSLLRTINEGIRTIPVNEIIALEKKWLPDSKTFFKVRDPKAILTVKQLDWLNSLPLLKMGIDPEWIPYDYLNEQNKHDGLSADYLEYIQKQLPIKTQVQLGVTWNQAFEKIKNKKIDLLSAVVKTPERQKFLNFTEPYASFPSVIATYKNSMVIQDMDSLIGKRLGIETGLILEDVFSKNHPDIKLVPFTRLENAIDSLAEGDVDAIVSDLASINRQIIVDKKTYLSIAAFTPYELELSIGVRKGLEPLVPILNAQLAHMPHKLKSSIANNWLGSRTDSSEEIQKYLRWGLPILGLLSGIILFIIYTNKKLRGEIEERKLIEYSLALEKQKSDAANQAKNDFLANMSHEIRTPMNAVIGMSDLLGQTPLNNEQSHMNETIRSATDSLLVIINDILDLSKIEAGKLEIEKTVFSLEKLFKRLEMQTAIELENKPLSIEFSLDEAIPKNLIGDSTRLGQVLLNLIHNAIKFTENGAIKVLCQIKKSESTQLCLEFTVTDTGIGISDEAMHKLFSTYGQADASTTRIYGGTGLGLSICKQLCELMGGSIQAESVYGKGSKFRFTVLLEKLSDSPEIVQKDSYNRNNHSIVNNSLSGVDVLVIDDNEVNLFIAKKMLTTAGATVSICNNAADGIEQLKNKTFDSVLIDIQMPIMDGYQATKIIREELQLNDIPIIAVTANVLESDIIESKKAGMTAHLGKPFNKEKMIQMIRKHLPSDKKMLEGISQ